MLVHLIVSPTLIVVDGGENAKSTIETSTVAGPLIGLKLETKVAGVNSNRDKAKSPLIARPHSDDEFVTAIIDSILLRARPLSQDKLRLLPTSLVSGAMVSVWDARMEPPLPEELPPRA